MPTATKTYSFTANTNAVAAQVERDFQDILDFLNVTKLDAANIQADAITAALIAANAVGSSEIAANAVGSSEIAAGAVTPDKMGISHISANGPASQLAINTAYQDAVVTASNPAAGTYLMIATVTVQAESTAVTFTVRPAVAGVLVGVESKATPALSTHYATIASVVAVAPNGSENVSIQVKADQVAGNAPQNKSRIALIRVG
jgi:hypothetical protein